jgi:hypothetical protein
LIDRETEITLDEAERIEPRVSSKEVAVVERHKIEIAFPSKTPDVAGRLVEDLSKEIRRSVKEDGRPVEATVTRPDPTAQEFGSTLVLALGTPAIIYLAGVIAESSRKSTLSGVEELGAANAGRGNGRTVPTRRHSVDLGAGRDLHHDRLRADRRAAAVRSWKALTVLARI